MKIISTRFKGLKILEGQSFFDNRGCFREVYKHNFLKSKKIIFWSISESKKNVVRGLHLQNKFKQAKLVTVVKGNALTIRNFGGGLLPSSVVATVDRIITSEMMIPIGAEKYFGSFRYVDGIPTIEFLLNDRTGGNTLAPDIFE